jgi:hypothetical protein
LLGRPDDFLPSLPSSHTSDPFRRCNGWIDLWVSAFLLLFIVATNIGLYLRLDIGVALNPGANAGQSKPIGPFSAALLSGVRKPISVLDLIFVENAISFYMGWTTVACIANVASAFTRSGAVPSLTGIKVLSTMLLVVAFALGGAAVVLRLDYAYTAAVAWAVLAISRQQADPAYEVFVPGIYELSNIVGWTLVLLACGAVGRRVVLWRGDRVQFAAFTDAADVEAKTEQNSSLPLLSSPRAGMV